MTAKTYNSPEAFKRALEDRLKNQAGGAEMNRARQLLVFDRFLARIAQTLGDAAIPKGGLVLELRLKRARTTRDIDLRMSGDPDEILEKLQEAGALVLGDFMTFTAIPDPRMPEIEGEGLIYEGYRFRCECRLGGKIYGQAFGVDVAYGDPITGQLETIQCKDTLASGIAPPNIKVYPRESHIAEKLHAYTMPRKTPNSRVKDLPDIALLASTASWTRSFSGRHSKRPSSPAEPTSYQHRSLHLLRVGLPLMNARRQRILWHGPRSVTLRRQSKPS